MKITDMCKRHTELNVLVCCLSCVRKITIYDGLEDHERVSCTPAAKLSSLCHFGIETIRVLQFACHKVIVWRLVNPLGWQTNSCMKISNVYLHVINKNYNHHYGMLIINNFVQPFDFVFPSCWYLVLDAFSAFFFLRSCVSYLNGTF